MQNDIFPILLGATDGAYALCRAFYHDYGIRPLVLDETLPDLFYHTACAQPKRVKNFSHASLFCRVLEDIYEDKRGKNLLLIPMTAAYADEVREREEHLVRMFLLPHLPSPLETKDIGAAKALVFLYRALSGACCTVYGELAAQTKCGAPLAFIARPIPNGIQEALFALSSNLSRGCYLFALSEQNEKTVFSPFSADFSPFASLTMAADVSIPELFLRETVFCEPLPALDETLLGAFSLFPYRKVKKYMKSTVKKECARLGARGAFLSLFHLRQDRFSLSLHRIFRDCYRQKTEQK